MENKEYLAIKNVCKSFFGVDVLKNVNFSAYRGEVHGLLGGNGAGKSTLMNILGGIYSKDSGSIEIDGKEVHITNTIKAEEAGIAFIHQELKLFDLRTVAENIMISKLPIKGIFKFVDDKKKNAEAKKWLDMVGLDVDPTTRLGDLSIAEQQQVEIAKALSSEAQILILDEPTSSLTRKETQILFDVIRKLKSEGVCLIYISHKFEEIFEICDKVTVLRNGENVGTIRTVDTNNDQLVDLVIGRKLEQYYPLLPPAPPESASNVLEVKNITNKKLNNASINLRKGEILGIFGLVGAGRSELARAIFGLDFVVSGEIYIEGEKKTIENSRQAMKAGISFLTENRREEGLVLKMNIRDNLTLPILKELTVPFIDFVKKKQERSLVTDAFQKFNIKATSPLQRTANLSGGNQQKVVLSKWFMTNSKVLILDEPTRGVDVGAKAEIYELLTKMIKEDNISVIFISSEAPEILGMSHRILVMGDGEIIGEFSGQEATEEKLLSLAMGGVKNCV